MCQASPYLYFHRCPHTTGALSTWLCLTSVHVSESGITCRWCPWLSPPHSHEAICNVAFLSDVMRCHGPPTEPEIIHLRQFNLGSLIHLLIFAMLFSSPTLGYMCMYMTHFYSQFLYPGSHVLPHFSSPDRLPSALPIGLFLLVRQPPQSICHHPQVNERWSFLSFSSI